MSVSTPLHEGVLDKWYHGRAIVVGDAAHKVSGGPGACLDLVYLMYGMERRDTDKQQFNPIIGLGGMSALETTTILTNSLTQLLKTSPEPSSSELEAIFAKTQNTRQSRAKALVDVSTATQNRFAMTTPWLEFLNRWYYPSMGPRSALRLLSEAYPGAASFTELPTRSAGEGQGDKGKGLPKWLSRAASRPALPYEDELKSPPRPRNGVVVALVNVLLLILSGLALSSRLWDDAAGNGTIFFFGMHVPINVMILLEGNRKRNTWSLIWRSVIPPTYSRHAARPQPRATSHS